MTQKVGRNKPLNKMEVWSVCRELSDRGEKITNEKIISRLGGGSHTTIGLLVKEYLEQHPNAAKYRKQRKYKIASPILGGDFFSREKDSKKIKGLFECISGYWEVFFYPTSSVNRVTRDVLFVKCINDFGYIDCAKYGHIYNYEGFCFQVANEYPHLYVVLDTQMEEFPEITFFLLTLPPIRFLRSKGCKPPNIYGIYVAISVYNLGNNLAGPAATKVGLRYLGDQHQEREIKDILCKEYLEYFDRCTEEYKERVGEIDITLPLEQFIAKFGPRDFCPYELSLKSSELKEIVGKISNEVGFKDSVPFVLRV